MARVAQEKRKYKLTTEGKKKSGFRGIFNLRTSISDYEILNYMGTMNSPRTLKQLYYGLGWRRQGVGINELLREIKKLQSKGLIATIK